MFEQTEYLLAYALVFAMLILGMLLVCVPRPRKKGFMDPETIAKEKRLRDKQKLQDKNRRKAEKAKKKKLAAIQKKKR